MSEEKSLEEALESISEAAWRDAAWARLRGIKALRRNKDKEPGRRSYTLISWHKPHEQLTWDVYATDAMLAMLEKERKLPMRTNPVTVQEWRAFDGTRLQFLAKEFPGISMTQCLGIYEAFDSMSETATEDFVHAINSVLGLKEPEPASTQRKPRVLTDDEAWALHDGPFCLGMDRGKTTLAIIAAYEKIRPSLFKCNKKEKNEEEK